METQIIKPKLRELREAIDEDLGYVYIIRWADGSTYISTCGGLDYAKEQVERYKDTEGIDAKVFKLSAGEYLG